MIHGPRCCPGAHTGLEVFVPRIHSPSLLEDPSDCGRAVRQPPRTGDLAHAVDQSVNRQALPTGQRLLARRTSVLCAHWPRGPTRLG